MPFSRGARVHRYQMMTTMRRARRVLLVAEAMKIAVGGAFCAAESASWRESLGIRRPRAVMGGDWGRGIAIIDGE